MIRSHSRKSHPADKSLPVERLRGWSRVVRRTMKVMHARKRRQWDARLVREASAREPSAREAST